MHRNAYIKLLLRCKQLFSQFLQDIRYVKPASSSRKSCSWRRGTWRRTSSMPCKARACFKSLVLVIHLAVVKRTVTCAWLRKLRIRRSKKTRSPKPSLLVLMPTCERYVLFYRQYRCHVITFISVIVVRYESSSCSDALTNFYHQI